MGFSGEDHGRGEGSWRSEDRRNNDQQPRFGRWKRGHRPGCSDHDSEGNTTGPRYLRSQGSRGNHCYDYAVTVERVHRSLIFPDSSTTITNVLGTVLLAPLAFVLCGPDCFDEVLVPTCYLHVGALDISHVRYELFEILRELSLFLRSMKEPLEPSKLCGELVSPVLFPQNALE